MKRKSVSTKKRNTYPKVNRFFEEEEEEEERRRRKEEPYLIVFPFSLLSYFDRRALLVRQHTDAAAIPASLPRSSHCRPSAR